LDRSRECITRARQRFPECEFHCHGWDALPDGPFDVILLASALHYADDQPALLHRLVERLDRDGVLVLELGLVASKKSEWVEVGREIDKRWFPSLMKLREVLAPYAFKWKGRSVDQAGDPVPRHVVHISRRRPVAYLLMKPPGFGKTSLVNQLFAPAGIHVVSGDKQMVRLADGQLAVPRAMHELVAGDFSRYTIDDSIERVFKHGFGREWIATWLAAAGGGDFAMDGYVPVDQHDCVRQYLVEAGYLPVTLDWDQPAPPALDDRKLRRQTKAFYRAMAKEDASTAANGRSTTDHGASVEGYVDRIKVARGRLLIEGWARNADGKVPEKIVVRLKDRLLTCLDFDVVSRPDVAKHVGTSDDRLGFRIELDADGMKTPSDLGGECSVAPLGASAFRLTPRVAKLRGRR
jgi:hypothetical protein